MSGAASLAAAKRRRSINTTTSTGNVQISSTIQPLNKNNNKVISRTVNEPINDTNKRYLSPWEIMRAHELRLNEFETKFSAIKIPNVEETFNELNQNMITLNEQQHTLDDNMTNLSDNLNTLNDKFNDINNEKLDDTTMKFYKNKIESLEKQMLELRKLIMKVQNMNLDENINTMKSCSLK
jgi:chromosome segregation ATPase